MMDPAAESLLPLDGKIMLIVGAAGGVGRSSFSARIALRDELPFPVHSKVILTRDGVVLSFVPSFHSVQPCELL
jgi:hypothetical protein